jgi:DNA-binding MarR family transcriptional regulator
MRRPIGEMRRRILVDLAEHGMGDVHPAHLNVFQHPGPRGLRPSELAAAAGMTKQAMNHVLGELESLGYIERRPMKEVRGTIIWTTKRGDAAIEAIRNAIRVVEAEWSDALGAKRYRTLRSLLGSLNEAIASP